MGTGVWWRRKVEGTDDCGFRVRLKISGVRGGVERAGVHGRGPATSHRAEGPTA